MTTKELERVPEDLRDLVAQMGGSPFATAPTPKPPITEDTGVFAKMVTALQMHNTGISEASRKVLEDALVEMIKDQPQVFTTLLPGDTVNIPIPEPLTAASYTFDTTNDTPLFWSKPTTMTITGTFNTTSDPGWKAVISGLST